MTYADPSACPSCRSPLPVAPVTCPRCGIALQGETILELFGTLTRADELVASLRGAVATRSAYAPEVGAPQAVPQGVPQARAPLPVPPRSGLTLPSVPVILLGLGAFCLLVASLIFLAFAWGWLGVGGRTAVLVALTLAFGGASWWLMRRGLRIASEAFLTVAFGLLLLDLFGAENAGWLGDPTGAEFATIAGLSLSVGGCAVALGFERLGLRRPWSVQIIAAIAALAVPLGLLSNLPSSELGSAIWVATAIGVSLLLDHLRLTAVSFGYAASAGLYWLHLVFSGIGRGIETPGYDEWLRTMTGWPFFAAAVLVALPAVRWRERPAFAGVFVSVSGALVTLWAGFPALSGTFSEIAAAATIVLAVWTLIYALVARAWWTVPLVPLIGASLVGGVVVLAGVAQISDRWNTVAGREQEWTYDIATGGPGHVWLLIPLVTSLTLAALVIWWREGGPLSGWDAAAASAPVLTACAFVWVAHDRPVAGGILLALLGAGLLAWWTQRSEVHPWARIAGGILALMLATSTWIPSLPSVGLLAATGLGITAIAGGMHLISRHESLRFAGGAITPIAAGIALSQAARAAGIATEWSGVPVFVALGVLIVFRPRWSVEGGAALTALITGMVCSQAQINTWADTAVYLTLAGVAVVATSLVNRDRRLVAPLGGLLLVAATWVRLREIGVAQPEPYTLPSALVLIALGLWWLRRDRSISTMRALLAGLLLATIPSLLWVTFVPPSNLRALLLGLGCLALLALGVAWRWTAPVVVGAVVGGLLVLVEIRPYAADIPPWVLIGVGGAVLITLGITWEARLRNVRSGLAYLARLR
jgi:hypothetical protein